MAQLDNAVFAMRSGGFGPFPKGQIAGAEACLGPPPPETELDLVGLWVSGEPWNVTGYGIRFAGHGGLSEQEMMDLEIAYADSADTVRSKMEFPALPADPEAADAFKAMTPLLKPTPDAPKTPPVADLVRGFSASLAEVIRAYAPKHATAIGTAGAEFVAGPKLGPALQAFAGLLIRSTRLNGDVPDLPAAEGAGAFFIAPNRAIDLRTLFDRAAFRSLMMGETVPRALGVAMFEARHALDERLAGERLPAQESWEAMIAASGDYFLSPDREMVGRIGAEILESKKPARPQVAEAEMEMKGGGWPDRAPSAEPPDGFWDVDGPIDDDDPASFGL